MEAGLTGRGREDASEVEKRIRRAKQMEPRGTHVIHIINEGTVRSGVEKVRAALTGQLKYSLWLVPPRTSGFEAAAAAQIGAQAAVAKGAKPFAVHVTIGMPFELSHASAIVAAENAAAAIGGKAAGGSLKVRLADVSTSSSVPFRALVAEVERTPSLSRACAAARLAVEQLTSPPASATGRAMSEDAMAAAVQREFRPHVSFMYGRHDERTLEAAAAALREALTTERRLRGFDACDLALVITAGTDHRCWSEVGRFPLSASTAGLKVQAVSL